jgi:hypothetical protein
MAINSLCEISVVSPMKYNNHKHRVNVRRPVALMAVIGTRKKIHYYLNNVEDHRKAKTLLGISKNLRYDAMFYKELLS